MKQSKQARCPLWILTSTYKWLKVPCRRISGCIQAHEGASKSVIWSGAIPKHALKAILKNVISVRKCKVNQCRDAKIAVCGLFHWIISLAAAFWASVNECVQILNGWKRSKSCEIRQSCRQLDWTTDFTCRSKFHLLAEVTPRSLHWDLMQQDGEPKWEQPVLAGGVWSNDLWFICIFWLEGETYLL